MVLDCIDSWSLHPYLLCNWNLMIFDPSSGGGTKKCCCTPHSCVYFLYLILNVLVNKFSVMSGRQVFLVGNSTKQGLMCLAQGHNAVRLELPTRRSRAKYSTTEPPPHIHVCKSRIKFGWISSNVLGDRIPDRRDGRRRLQYPQRFFFKKR